MRRSLQHQKHVLKRPPIYNKTIYSFYSFTQKMYVWFTFQECHCTFEGQKSFYAIEDDPVCGPCAGIIEWYFFICIWKPLEPAVTVIIILSFISEITKKIINTLIYALKSLLKIKSLDFLIDCWYGTNFDSLVLHDVGHFSQVG